MDHLRPQSILDFPSIPLDLTTRQAFGLAYALGSYLSRLCGPATGMQRELAALVCDIRDLLPAQCRDLLDAPVRQPLTEVR